MSSRPALLLWTCVSFILTGACLSRATVVAAAPTVSAQVSSSISISDFIDTHSKLSRSELLLRTEMKEIAPLGFVSILKNSSLKKAVGAAIRICLDPDVYRSLRAPYVITKQDPYPSTTLEARDSRRDYFITPAHVLDGNGSLELTQVGSFGIEFVDAGMDLALISAPRLKNTPCATLLQSLDVGTVLEIEAAVSVPPTALRLEAPTKNMERIAAWQFETRMASTPEWGNPGRDQAGPLLMLLAQGFRGQSGSALIKDSKTPQLVGMVLATDARAVRLQALPSPSIYKRIVEHFSGKILTSKPDRIRTRNGTIYLASGAIHYRRSLTDVSGDLNDGSGDYSKFDNPSSGIQVGSRRFLSLDPAWVEYEPLPSCLISRLSRPSELRGIYEENGKLYATDAGITLPKRIPGSGHDALVLDFGILERDRLSIMGAETPPCWFSAGVELKNEGTGRVFIVACERLSNTKAETWFWVQREKSSDQLSHLLIRSILDMDSRCQGPQGSCPIVHTGAIAAFSAPMVDIEQSATSFQRFVWTTLQNMPVETWSPMPTTGLHSIHAPGFHLLFGKQSGLRVNINRKQNLSLRIRGPMTTPLASGASLSGVYLPGLSNRSGLGATNPYLPPNIIDPCINNRITNHQ